MSISYKKLKILMVQNDMKLKDLHECAGLCSGTISKINKGEYINLQSLIKICEYISKASGAKIKIDDLIEY